MPVGMWRHLTTFTVALTVILGAQLARASSSGADEEPNTDRLTNQQFAAPQIPGSLRAQIGLVEWGAAKVGLNSNSSSPQVTYGISQEIKDNSGYSEIVKKGVCAWNTALSTPCDSPSSFLVEGVQPYSTETRPGIKITLYDDVQTAGSGSSWCNGADCVGSIKLSTTYLKGDEGVNTVVHELGHVFNLWHAIDKDSWDLSLSSGGAWTLNHRRWWHDCSAIMAYTGSNCYGKGTPVAPTSYEAECVKSLYGFPGSSPNFCQAAPQITWGGGLGSDNSVPVTVAYKCDDASVKSLEVTVLQGLTPSPNWATGKASAPVTCDGSLHNQSLTVTSSRPLPFGHAQTGVTAHLVDADGNIKGNADAKKTTL